MVILQLKPDRPALSTKYWDAKVGSAEEKVWLKLLNFYDSTQLDIKKPIRRVVRLAHK